MTDSVERRRGGGPEELGREIAKGVVTGLRELSRDEEFMHAFWKQGWKELASHTTNNASMWVGKRIVAWAVGILVAVGVAYLVKIGAVK